MKVLLPAIGFLAVLAVVKSVPVESSYDDQRKIRSDRIIKDPTPEDIEFQLFTRSNREDYHRLSASDSDSITSSTFESSKPLIVVAHGFNENANGSIWMHPLKNLYLDRDDVNVILVNWAPLVAGIRYDIAHTNTFFAGEQLAVLLHAIQGLYSDFSGDQVHLIGFSLGAHLMGTAGRDFSGINRLTGLDAAGPLFNGADTEHRLDPSDATFVDLIHTNAGVMLTGHFGFNLQLGHVDFYVNGGQFQFGCPNFFYDVISDLVNLHPEDIDACSHGRAHEYFVESVQHDFEAKGYMCMDDETFQSGNCLSNQYNIIGEHVMRDRPGTYYINTRGEDRYFGNHLELSLVIGGDETYHGQIHVSLDLLNRVNRTTEVTTGWPSLENGHKLTTAIVMPVESDIKEERVRITFEKNSLLPLAPNHVVFDHIEAYNAIDNSRYCYGTDLTLNDGDVMELYPTSAGC